MTHTVKGFGIVNKAELDVFLELSCFFYDPVDVANLISGNRLRLLIYLFIYLFCTSHPRQILGHVFHGSEHFPHQRRLQHYSYWPCNVLYLGAWMKITLYLSSHTNKSLMIGLHSTKRRQIITLVYVLWWKLSTWEFAGFNINVSPTEISRSEFFNRRSRSLRPVVCSPGCTVGLPGELEKKKNYPTSKILIFWSGIKGPELLFKKKNLIR